jgi:hypothetical protein
MSLTGLDPQVLANLDGLGPRDELVMRLALREVHNDIRSDRSFGDRIKQLLERLDPRPREMAAILAEARETEKRLRPRGEA